MALSMSANGFASQSVEILGVGYELPDVNHDPLELPEELELPAIRAFRCVPEPCKGRIAPMRARRLGRAQKLALSATCQALGKSAVPDGDLQDAGVCVGTGLGELGETVLFLENMVRLKEKEPKPTRFINSVHNSLASQIAINFNFGGENHTITHGAVSFELALWQATALLKTGRARYVLACGADELHPYGAYAGTKFGLARSPCGVSGTHEVTPVVPYSALPGEGAAAFLLGRRSKSRHSEKPPPCIRGVCVRPLASKAANKIDPHQEATFIEDLLLTWGLGPGDIDFVLLGAGAAPRIDRLYGPIISGLSHRAGKEIAQGAYKHLCGDFCTAPALGFAFAVEMIQNGKVSSDFIISGPTPDGAPRRVLLYHLTCSGFRSVCVVTEGM
jgi:3-oxoacyl-[acyl-carrier-protein] synthase II